MCSHCLLTQYQIIALWLESISGQLHRMTCGITTCDRCLLRLLFIYAQEPGRVMLKRWRSAGTTHCKYDNLSLGNLKRMLDTIISSVGELVEAYRHRPHTISCSSLYFVEKPCIYHPSRSVTEVRRHLKCHLFMMIIVFTVFHRLVSFLIPH